MVSINPAPQYHSQFQQPCHGKTSFEFAKYVVYECLFSQNHLNDSNFLK